MHGDVLQPAVFRHAVHGVAAADVIHGPVARGIDLRRSGGVAQPVHDAFVLQARFHLFADIGIEDRHVTAFGGDEVHRIARRMERIPRMHDFAEADAGRQRGGAMDLAAGQDEEDAWLRVGTATGRMGVTGAAQPG